MRHKPLQLESATLVRGADRERRDRKHCTTLSILRNQGEVTYFAFRSGENQINWIVGAFLRCAGARFPRANRHAFEIKPNSLHLHLGLQTRKSKGHEPIDFLGW